MFIREDNQTGRHRLGGLAFKPERPPCVTERLNCSPNAQKPPVTFDLLAQLRKLMQKGGDRSPSRPPAGEKLTLSLSQLHVIRSVCPVLLTAYRCKVFSVFHLIHSFFSSAFSHVLHLSHPADPHIQTAARDGSWTVLGHRRRRVSARQRSRLTPRPFRLLPGVPFQPVTHPKHTSQLRPLPI